MDELKYLLDSTSFDKREDLIDIVKASEPRVDSITDSLKIVLPKEYSDRGVIELTTQEQKKLVAFWKNLISLYEKDKFVIVFRGQKKQTLEKVLSGSFTDEAGKLFCKIFYFGDKAKHFFTKKKMSQIVI